jgi:hypothetical protein
MKPSIIKGEYARSNQGCEYGSGWIGTVFIYLLDPDPSINIALNFFITLIETPFNCFEDAYEIQIKLKQMLRRFYIFFAEV